MLEDSEGEFLQCEPTYKDPPRRVHLVEDPQVIDDLREQLEAAEQTLATARSRDVEQAQGLQEALRSQAAELREAHQAEVTAWKQQLDAEKERARKRWKTNCEHLAEQDAIIAAHEEEIATLQEQVGELRTWAPGGHTEPLSPPADTGFLPPEERRPPAETRSHTACQETSSGPREEATEVGSVPPTVLGRGTTLLATLHPSGNSPTAFLPPSSGSALTVPQSDATDSRRRHG